MPELHATARGEGAAQDHAPLPLGADRVAELWRIARKAASWIWRGVGLGDHGLFLEDLESEAMEAILAALPRHDPNGGDTFLWIRAKGAALDALRDADPLSRNQRADHRERGELSWVLVEHGDRYDPTILAADARDRDDRLAARLMVRSALADLREPERSVLARIYLDDQQQDRVALERGVTAARISQIHAKALLMLRAALVRRHGAAALA